MTPETSSFKIHAWLAWSLLFGLVVALVLLVPVHGLYNGRTQTVAEYLDIVRHENISGHGLSDWQWMLFLLTSLVAMYRIAQGEIKQDGGGWLVCASGVLLFGLAMRLGDIPRVACLGLPLILYGGARHIFGPVGKCMFLPSLIFLLIIPLRQITWLEQSFFVTVTTVILWCGGDQVRVKNYYFLCNDIYYASVLRDTITGLLLLFFLTRMRASNMVIIALLVMAWSFVAAVGYYVFEYIHAPTFHNISVSTLARSSGWVLPLMILVYDVYCRRNKKSF